MLIHNASLTINLRLFMALCFLDSSILDLQPPPPSLPDCCYHAKFSLSGRPSQPFFAPWPSAINFPLPPDTVCHPPFTPRCYALISTAAHPLSTIPCSAARKAKAHCSSSGTCEEGLDERPEKGRKRREEYVKEETMDSKRKEINRLEKSEMSLGEGGWEIDGMDKNGCSVEK